MKKTLLLFVAICALAPLFDTVRAEIHPTSGIYVGGHIRRARPGTITKLRESGFTYAILFNVHVDPDGTLKTDGETICENGKYVFSRTQPHYVEDVRNLKTWPTSIVRLEICIGGWGNDSYNNIKKLINENGTGRTTMLYRNFKALLDSVPGIDAVNNDDEQCYDVSTASKFHIMMYDLGIKTSLAPYTYMSFWQNLATSVNNARPGAVDLVLVQCYDGGAGNDPRSWNFSGIERHAGRTNYQDDWSFTKYTDKLQEWKKNGGAVGGFIWVYNDESWDLHKYATSMNQIFFPRTAAPDTVAAKVYTEKNYGGYGVELGEGVYSKSDLAVLGLPEKSIASAEVTEGYRVKFYKTPALTGAYSRLDKSRTSILGTFAGNICSLSIEKLPADGVDATADNAICLQATDGELLVENAAGKVLRIYGVGGQMVMSASIKSNAECIQLSPLPQGVYVAKVEKERLKFSK